MELPLLEASLQLHHYPKSVIYDMRVLTPGFRRSTLVNPHLSLSLDGNQLMGAIIRSSHGPKETAIVDGKIDETETKMLGAELPKEGNWLYVSTNKQMDIIAFFDFIGATDEPLSLVYNDNESIQESSERYPGQLPNIGYVVENFPEEGLFGFAVSMYFSENFKGRPEEFNREIRSSPSIRIINKS